MHHDDDYDYDHQHDARCLLRWLSSGRCWSLPNRTRVRIQWTQQLLRCLPGYHDHDDHHLELDVEHVLMPKRSM
jgi:hypothetical protein